jgi:hypothetical protein
MLRSEGCVRRSRSIPLSESIPHRGNSRASRISNTTSFRLDINGAAGWHAIDENVKLQEASPTDAMKRTDCHSCLHDVMVLGWTSRKSHTSALRLLFGK